MHATSKVSIELVENAFLPAKEITDPARFAGRQHQVEQCYLGLVSEGANIALLGNRGVGKSSLARQLINLAQGDTALLDRHKISHGRKLDFLPVYYTCSSSVSSIDHLLECLLSSENCLAPWIYEVPQAKLHLETYSPKYEATLLGTSIEASKTKSTTTISQHVGIAANTATVFSNVCAAFCKVAPASDGVLLIVDEFDQIKDKSGFASLLKSMATNVPKVRFAIVGVAHDLYGLMLEHQSSDRLFAGGVVPVPSMSPNELNEVIDMAQNQIDNQIVFQGPARDKIVELAQGHPYMLHLLGKHALRTAWRSQRSVISPEDIETTLRNIAASGADPVLEGRYKKAIASSSQREVVLRALADSDKSGEIWTGDAYPVAIRFGVENPSQYVGNLVTEEYGSEIVKARERYYRFRDSLFRAYVRARPKQYELTGASETTAICFSNDKSALDDQCPMPCKALPHLVFQIRKPQGCRRHASKCIRRTKPVLCRAIHDNKNGDEC